jgi:TonB-linked SusC/RagA family outer membrane protein
MKRLLSIFLCFIGIALAGIPINAQEKIHVTGQVFDASTGETLIQASVIVKGTTQGVVTDLDGNFSISVARGSELVFGSLGYEDMTVVVKDGASPLRIALKPSAELIEDLVVVAYGTVKKENLSGAVDQVSSDVFEGRPQANASQMLQGVIPNLNIELENGRPGVTANYNIRGTTSIGSGGSALILIDGVEGEPNLLNPNDIESVSVLKDAAASAIYGSRATFGVVLITTKDPSKKKDHFSINYSSNFSVLKPLYVPDIVTDGYIYSKVFFDAYTNWYNTQPTGINKSQDFNLSWLDDFRLRKLEGNTRTTTLDSNGKYVYYGNTNYYDLLYKDSVSAQTHNVSVSGSSQRISYYLSGRLYKYDGLFNFNPDNYKTFNIRGKARMQVLPWLSVTENMSYDYELYHIPISYTGESKGNFWRSINDEAHPSSPAFNPDGSMTLSTAYSIGGLITGNNYDDRLVKTFKSTTGVKASFFDDTFSLNADFSLLERDKNNVTKRTAVPYSTHFGVTEYLGVPFSDERIMEYDSIHHYLSFNAYSNYENTFGKHYLKGLLGYNYEERTEKGTYVDRYGLITPEVNALNLAIGEMITSSSTGSKWKVAGFFFRVNYGYDDRYLLEVNGRYDGSSKFPINSQWGFFPSASAAWRVSKEPWWKVNPSIVSNLKLRGSFGELGNGNVGVYAFMEKFSFSTMNRVLDGSSKQRHTQLPSQIPDNLTWETAQTADIGLDVGFLRGKLELTADIYRRKTYNMYTAGPTLPDTYGASAPKGNYADLHTDGFELTLTYNDAFNLAGKPLHYNLKGTLADSRAWIDKYYNPTGNINDYYVGEEIGDLWGFVVTGIFQTQEEIDNFYGPGLPYVNNKFKTSVDGATVPGDIIIQDLNGNQIIDFGSETLSDPGDKRIIGNTRPRYIYSFNLGFDWNGFFASAFFQGVGRRHWYPSAECNIWGPFNRPYNQIPKWLIGNYWTEDNRDAWLPRLAGYHRAFYSGYENSRYLFNAAYLRFKNLQIGYNLPKAWVKKAQMSEVSIYLSGENLYTWSPVYRRTRDIDVVTAMHGSDSELSSENLGDGDTYPAMRTLSLGINIKF